MKSVHIQSYSGPHFYRIRTKYGEILRISPYSVRMRENVDQNNSEYGHFLRSDRNKLWEVGSNNSPFPNCAKESPDIASESNISNTPLKYV